MTRRDLLDLVTDLERAERQLAAASEIATDSEASPYIERALARVRATADHVFRMSHDL